MVAVVTVTHLSRGWQIPSMHAASMARYRQWLVQVITGDCEKVFEMPCHRCGTNQLQSQMKRVECRDRERCNETRESLLDDDVCISHGGNSSPALRRKRPTGDIQTQTQKPLGRDSNRTADGSEPLARRTKAADTAAMDIDVISDQAQHPKANTASMELGAETEPGEVSASGGKATVTADKQRNPKDAYQANRIPQHMKDHKRQRLLTEYQQTATSRSPLVAKPTSSNNEKQGKPIPRTKRVQSGGGGPSWVCNLLGAKQVSSGPVAGKKTTADSCAKCTNPLAGNCSSTQCFRCNNVKYCNDACRKLHWKQGHGKTCTSGNTGCPACGEEVSTDAETSTPCVRCEQVVYCSHRCLNSDFDSHLHQCPLVLPAVVNSNRQQMAVGKADLSLIHI